MAAASSPIPRMTAEGYFDGRTFSNLAIRSNSLKEDINGNGWLRLLM